MWLAVEILCTSVVGMFAMRVKSASEEQCSISLTGMLRAVPVEEIYSHRNACAVDLRCVCPFIRKFARGQRPETPTVLVFRCHVAGSTTFRTHIQQEGSQ